MTWYRFIKDVNLIYNYYADPGRYIEGKGWEYANLENKIKTGNRIYSHNYLIIKRYMKKFMLTNYMS